MTEHYKIHFVPFKYSTDYIIIENINIRITKKKKKCVIELLYINVRSKRQEIFL